MWYKTPKPMFIRPYELPHEVYYFANCAFTAYWYACPFIFFCFSHHNSYNGKVNSSAESNEIGGSASFTPNSTTTDPFRDWQSVGVEILLILRVLCFLTNT